MLEGSRDSNKKQNPTSLARGQRTPPERPSVGAAPSALGGICGRQIKERGGSVRGFGEGSMARYRAEQAGPGDRGAPPRQRPGRQAAGRSGPPAPVAAASGPPLGPSPTHHPVKMCCAVLHSHELLAGTTWLLPSLTSHMIYRQWGGAMCVAHPPVGCWRAAPRAHPVLPGCLSSSSRVVVVALHAQPHRAQPRRPSHRRVERYNASRAVHTPLPAPIQTCLTRPPHADPVSPY